MRRNVLVHFVKKRLKMVFFLEKIEIVVEVCVIERDRVVVEASPVARVGAEWTTVGGRWWGQFSMRARMTAADGGGRIIATRWRQRCALGLCVAQCLQSMHQTRVRYVAEMQQPGDGRAKHLQLGQLVVRVGQLRTQTGDVLSHAL